VEEGTVVSRPGAHADHPLELPRFSTDEAEAHRLRDAAFPNPRWRLDAIIDGRTNTVAAVYLVDRRARPPIRYSADARTLALGVCRVALQAADARRRRA
jgi:hypothetical protein